MKQTSLFILFTYILFTACAGRQTEEKLVSVTIEPQRYFAEKIAGDKFVIHTVVPAGQNPEIYDPTPQQMVKVSKSEAYLRVGHLGLEEVWVSKLLENNSHMKVFDLSEGFSLIENEEEYEHEHQSGEVYNHAHHGVDPHIWSSVAGAKKMAWNVLYAFIDLDKDNTSYYWENYNRLMSEIEETEQQIARLLESLDNRTFIIYHPALTYFSHEYGLTQLSIEMEGKEPSPAQLKQLIDTARTSGAKVVFIQQEFDQKNAELIAKETNCKLVVINPLAYDWKKEMIHIAQALADGETY
ncbi:MAG: zinc ABC transporter substrate-binding protein [Massilibacteroides sp.]|nr:zinc ABC transporter substrate-binding protein [Massilibacteroides sp.]MDD3061812.1 zinc ABC transporter substrate-binding protein [Massilibacteroides sp.]MDD4115413.1 zinc ABC transporter substrate-binding protein [Massilibacteroides sp.]MDD4660094.1 zinc ABC transporter substrate-binding protein [Massilibacteroides sp.]